MKHPNPLTLSIAMLLAFVLVAGSAAQWSPLSLSLATVVGLGIPAGVLLLAHRARLSETFCGQGDCPRTG